MTGRNTRRYAECIGRVPRPSAQQLQVHDHVTVNNLRALNGLDQPLPGVFLERKVNTPLAMVTRSTLWRSHMAGASSVASPRQSFAAMAAQPDEGIDVARGALLVAQEEY